MSLRIGGTPIVGLRLGSTPIQQLRLGSTIIWSASGAGIIRVDFNQADQIGLGADWTSHGGVSPYLASISSGYARINIPDGLLFLGLQEDRVRYNATTLPGDDGHIRVKIASMGDGTGYFAARSQAFRRLSNAAFTHGVGIELSNSQLKIVRRVASVDTIMANCGTYQPGDEADLVQAGDVHTMLLNGTDVGAWNDSGHTASKGAGFLSIGLMFSGGKDGLGPRRFSPAFDYVEAA